MNDQTGESKIFGKPRISYDYRYNEAPEFSWTIIRTEEIDFLQARSLEHAREIIDMLQKESAAIDAGGGK